MCARKIFCKRTYPVGERDMCHSTLAFSVCAGIVFPTFRENKVLCKGDGRVSKVPHIRTFPTLPSPLDETIFIHIFHVIRRRMCARKIVCKRTYPVGERDMCHSTVASSVSQCLRYHLLGPAQIPQQLLGWRPHHRPGIFVLTCLRSRPKLPRRALHSSSA